MSTKEFAAFETLDLSPIKMKLMHVESGEGWSKVRADAVEAEYRRFLFLMKKYPDADASPTVDVDTFWHYHILDTMKYARDCEALFGYFLHHYPYVGIGADANDGDHAAGGQRMREIYEAEFGAMPAAGAAHAFCSSSDERREAAGATYAYCAGPGKPRDAASATYAYCAGPGKPREAANATHAYCAGPGKPREAANDAHAYCAAPGKPLKAASAAYAYCAGPGKPREAANAAYAYCAAPGKELVHAA
ncbi:MAG: glycine-rich domain-containing protein-like [Lysobacteraceae bacterium]|nr:MAG: glycine-rich domain-containing protein-like [Xanthomonadaceae bacterium]